MSDDISGEAKETQIAETNCLLSGQLAKRLAEIKDAAVSVAGIWRGSGWQQRLSDTSTPYSDPL